MVDVAGTEEQDGLTPVFDTQASDCDEGDPHVEKSELCACSCLNPVSAALPRFCRRWRHAPMETGPFSKGSIFKLNNKSLIILINSRWHPGGRLLPYYII